MSESLQYLLNFQSQFGYSLGQGVPQGFPSSPQQTFMFGNPKPLGDDFYRLVSKPGHQANFGGVPATVPSSYNPVRSRKPKANFRFTLGKISFSKYSK